MLVQEGAQEHRESIKREGETRAYALRETQKTLRELTRATQENQLEIGLTAKVGGGLS